MVNPKRYTRKCKHCGTIFRPGVGTHAVFCGPECKVKQFEIDCEESDRPAYLPCPDTIAAFYREQAELRAAESAANADHYRRTGGRKAVRQ